MLSASRRVSYCESTLTEATLPGLRSPRRAPDSEIEFRIHALRVGMNNRMRTVIREAQENARASQEADGELRSSRALDAESRAHGIDLDALREIKAVFDSYVGDNRRDDIRGVSEEEFIATFGRTLCAGMTPDELRVWFRGVDMDCSGRVTWDEISAYLVSGGPTGGNEDVPLSFADTPIEARAAITGRAGTAGVTHIAYANNGDTVFTGSADGIVRSWTGVALRGGALPIHTASQWITGLTYIPSSGRLLVMHGDRTILLFTVSSSGKVITTAPSPGSGSGEAGSLVREVGPANAEFYRGFGLLGASVTATRSLATGLLCTDGSGSSGGGGGDHNRRPWAGAGVSMRGMSVAARRAAAAAAGGSGEAAAVPVTLLAPQTAGGAVCIDHAGSIAAGEVVLVGTESGVVETWQLHQSDKPLVPTQRFRSTHNTRVTQITMAPDLEGFLSSCADGSVAVTSIEKNIVVHSFVPLDILGSGGSGGGGGSPPRSPSGSIRRPVFCFDYAREYNATLAYAQGRTVQVWNAVTGVRHATLPLFDRPVHRVALNPSLHHLYTLLEGKVIKVWDMRVWRIVETITDTVARAPADDNFTEMKWCQAHSMLLCGAAAGQLVGWQTLDTQERRSAGVEPVAAATTTAAGAEVVGHLHPLQAVHLAQKSGLVIGVDSVRVIVWSAATYEPLWNWRWRVNGAVTCTSLESGELKLLIGTDEGTVAWINYSSGIVTNELRWTPAAIGKTSLDCAGGGSAITAVAYLDSVLDSINLSVATCGSTLVSWVDNSRKAVTRAKPTSYVALPETDGTLVSVARTGMSNSVLVVTTNSGACFGVNLPMLTVLFRIPAPGRDVTAESLVPLIPGLFLTGYSNGCVRLFTFTRETSVAPVAYFSGAVRANEAVSCATLMANRNWIALGDTAGGVTIFSLGKLLHPSDLRSKIVPNVVLGRSTEQTLTTSCCHLVGSWLAHYASVTGIEYVEKSQVLVTCASDRRIRAWDIVSHKLLCDFGRSIFTMTPRDPTLRKMTPHPFSVGGTTQPVADDEPIVMGSGVTGRVRGSSLAYSRVSQSAGTGSQRGNSRPHSQNNSNGSNQGASGDNGLLARLAQVPPAGPPAIVTPAPGINHNGGTGGGTSASGTASNDIVSNTSFLLARFGPLRLREQASGSQSLTVDLDEGASGRSTPQGALSPPSATDPATLYFELAARRTAALTALAAKPRGPPLRGSAGPVWGPSTTAGSIAATRTASAGIPGSLDTTAGSFGSQMLSPMSKLRGSRSRVGRSNSPIGGAAGVTTAHTEPPPRAASAAAALAEVQRLRERRAEDDLRSVPREFSLLPLQRVAQFSRPSTHQAATRPRPMRTIL